MTSEEAIFAEALRRGSTAEESDYLDQACAGDPRLRRDVQKLLDAHRRVGGILELEPVQAAGGGDESPAAEAVGAMLGPYKLLERIGGGGMGVVYMAEQFRPVRRKVALKIVKPGMDSGQVIARFEAERQALTLMDHPNIAKVLDAGTTDTGRPYFVMELVKGIPITDYCDQARLTTRQRLELFVKVCNAVQHAHQKGVIHRDLKPTNVLVTLHDDKPVPKVIDFGIAKAAGQQLTERTLFTNYAQMLGTPLYMSPEQAQLSGLDVDTRSDVYSLGVLLYELLTGTTPFNKRRLREAAYDEMRRIIREEEPAKPSTRLDTMGARLTTISANRQTDPRKLDQLVRGELDWIVMKALEKDRTRRYETANDLGRDVERHLCDEAVEACPQSATYRCWKFGRRNKVALVTATVMALGVLTAVAGLAMSTVLISREQQLTTAALSRETLAKGDLQRTANSHRITLAYRELSADNLGRTQQLLDDCPKDLRDWEWHYLNRLCRVEPVVLHDACEVHCTAFSPDGVWVAAGCGDHTIKIWDIVNNKVLLTLRGHQAYVFSVAFSPDGRHVASAGADRTVRLWDLSTEREVFCVAGHVGDYAGTAYSVAFSPDGRRLVAGGDHGVVTIWDTTDGHAVLQLPERHESPSVCAAFSSDGSALATGSWSGALRISDARTGRLLHKFNAHSRRMSAAIFSPDGRRIATASFDRTVKVWDASTYQLLHTLGGRIGVGHTGIVTGLAFSRDGRRLFTSGGEDKTVKVWDPDTGEEVLNLRGHTLFCHGLAVSADGARLASAGKDGTIRVWDGTPLKGDEGLESVTREHESEVWSVAFSSNGRYLASASWGERSVRVWDATGGALLRTLPLPPDAMYLFHLGFSPDGTRIATAASSTRREAVVNVWEAATGREVFNSIREEKSEPFFVTFDPKGKYLVREGPDHTVQVRDADTGKFVGVLGRHDLQIWGMAFSPDGARLATASNDGKVRIWVWGDSGHGTEQKPERALDVHADGYGDRVAFSTDGRYLATGGERSSIQIWDVTTGKVQHVLSAHTGDVFSVAFSPDGRWLATAGEDTTVRIWNTATWKLRRTLRGHRGWVMSLAFSHDSKRLASGSRDHTMKLWDTAGWDDLPDH